MHASWEAIRKHWPSTEIRIALYNGGHLCVKPFLQTTEQDLQGSLDTHVNAAFSFSREAILSFLDQPLNDKGKRGTLLITGATASLRGNTTTSVFAAGKFGLRALSQSLNKEFGQKNIHVRTSAVYLHSIVCPRSAETRE